MDISQVLVGRKTARENERNAMIGRYKVKYGDDWEVYYNRDTGLMSEDDCFALRVNQCIYFGSLMAYFYAYPADRQDSVMQTRFGPAVGVRLHDLFGDYSNVWPCDEGSDVVKTALLDDAVRTGLWRLLPLELRDEGRKRLGL